MTIIIAIILLLLLVYIVDNRDDNYTFYGGKKDVTEATKNKKERFLRESPSRKMSDALRIFIISNKINEVLNIPESSRQWITSFYYSFINYLALNKPAVYADADGFFSLSNTRRHGCH